MTLTETLLGNLQFERRLTRETITAMTDGDMRCSVSGEQMAFGQQALHIISCQRTLNAAMRGEGWTWDRGFTLESYPDQAAILAEFDAMHQAELAYYASLSDGDWQRPVPTGWGEPEPLIQLFVSFLTHEAHHRGQMITMLRSKGMTPAKY